MFFVYSITIPLSTCLLIVIGFTSGIFPLFLAILIFNRIYLSVSPLVLAITTQDSVSCLVLEFSGEQRFYPPMTLLITLTPGKSYTTPPLALLTPGGLGRRRPRHPKRTRRNQQPERLIPWRGQCHVRGLEGLGARPAPPGSPASPHSFINQHRPRPNNN